MCIGVCHIGTSIRLVAESVLKAVGDFDVFMQGEDSENILSESAAGPRYPITLKQVHVVSGEAKVVAELIDTLKDILEIQS